MIHTQEAYTRRRTSFSRKTCDRFLFCDGFLLFFRSCLVLCCRRLCRKTYFQDLVVQYEVQVRDGANCGGAYVKVRRGAVNVCRKYSQCRKVLRRPSGTPWCQDITRGHTLCVDIFVDSS